MKRDISLDILRCIALICIIIVHIHPTSIFVNQIRCFDVPLMVFLSGISYALSNTARKEEKKELDYSKYFVKRFKRLIIPSWIFLLTYYVFFHIAYFLFCNNAHILWLDMLHDFTFFTGWYVWIIRVFFIIALCAPLISSAIISTSNWKVIIVCLSILLIFEFIPLKREDSITYYIGMVIPYISIFTFGLIANKVSKKSLLLMAAFFMCIYIGYAIYYINTMGDYQLTSIQKYPPKLYYSSYAISLSLLLYVFRRKILSFCSMIKVVSIFEFLGSHTIWIYFWHIPLIKPIMIIPSDSLRFFIVITTATAITYLQTKIVNKVIIKIKKDSIKRNLRIIFIG